MQPWQPSTPFEDNLQAAHLAEDTSTCFGLLQQTEFALPITPAAAAGKEPARWATASQQDRTWLLAFTSAESMAFATKGPAEHFRVMSLVELAAAWPDPRWILAVNPGLPIQLLLESGTVARLAAPPLSDLQAAAPSRPPPLVQKILAVTEPAEIFRSRNGRISGYVHLAADVAHIGSPNVLLDALGRTAQERDLIDDDGSVFVMRWPALGADLYRTPFGGTTEEACTAVHGWVVEEPPFLGTGFVASRDQVIREFKVDGVRLPYRAEISELDIDGNETRRAIWDGNRDSWLLARLVQVTEGESE